MPGSLEEREGLKGCPGNAEVEAGGEVTWPGLGYVETVEMRTRCAMWYLTERRMKPSRSLTYLLLFIILE